MTGPFEGAPLVLLTTTGAKSGLKRVNPLMALVEGDTLYVFASKAGAPADPDWYHNLLANPEVEVEFGDERFAAVATPVTGPGAGPALRRPGGAEPGVCRLREDGRGG